MTIDLKNHKKNHKSYDVVLTLQNPRIIDLGLTRRPQALPDEFKKTDPIKAYRQYYKARKSHLAHWTMREIPVWFLEEDCDA